MTSWREIKELVCSREEEMVLDLMEMSHIPSVNPRMGGDGEYKRMIWIKDWLEKNKIDFEVYEIPDQSVREGKRLNLVVTHTAREAAKTPEKSLWFISHVDTVNAGDISQWDTDPFAPVRKGGKVYGLGVEDNSQAVITTLAVLKIMKEQEAGTDCNIKFMFVSDEETGSRYGLCAMMEAGIFSGDDEAVVPDGGSRGGDLIEVAEKSQVWLQFTIKGKQGHASMPQLGINACSVGMHFGAELEDTLKTRFSRRDSLFLPDYSTFEPTQKFSNVDSPNVLPGEDKFVMDMRILPCYSIDQVMETVDQVMRKYEQKYKIAMSREFITCVPAPEPTKATSKVVKNLLSSLKELGVNAYCGGIGGGTCAAILRKHNIPAVVWATLDDMAHQPNEYIKTENLVRDATVYLSVIRKYTGLWPE